jgi:hypothetical protein
MCCSYHATKMITMFMLVTLLCQHDLLRAVSQKAARVLMHEA